jgi:hypothetical protein
MDVRECLVDVLKCPEMSGNVLSIDLIGVAEYCWNSPENCGQAIAEELGNVTQRGTGGVRDREIAIEGRC